MVKKIKSDQTFDYVFSCRYEFRSSSEDDLMDLHNHLLTNTNLILESIEHGVILDALLEATTGGKKALLSDKGRKVIGSAKKVIEFIKNMFGRFKDFITSVFQNNEKWLLDRENEFKDMNYNGLGISMVPYWEGKNIDNTYNAIYKRIENSIDRAQRDDTYRATFVGEKGITDVFEPYLDSSNDHTDGIKNMLRVANKNGLDEVELRESELKNKIINEFIPYLKNYSKYVNNAQRNISAAERLLNTVENEMGNRQITESFIEGIPLSQTDLMYCENYDLLLEAENTANNNQTNSNEKPKETQDNKEDKNTNSNSKDSTSGKTSVTVLDKKSSQDVENEKNVKSSSDDRLRILRQSSRLIQILIACQLTVYEERYTAYFNAVKAVYKEANTRHGRKGNQEGKDENK